MTLTTMLQSARKELGATDNLIPLVYTTEQKKLFDYVDSLKGSKALFISWYAHGIIPADFETCEFTIRPVSKIESHRPDKKIPYDAHIWGLKGDFAIGLSSLLEIVPLESRLDDVPSRLGQDPAQNYDINALKVFNFSASAGSESESLQVIDFDAISAYIAGRTQTRASSRHRLDRISPFLPGHTFYNHETYRE